LGVVEAASAFPASVACTGSTTGVASLLFTLDSKASSCFFRDCTYLTPLRTPVSISLANSTAGPVVACSTTTLPCPAAPSGFLTGYYTPSFSRNLLGVSHLHDLGVVTTFTLVEPVAYCTIGVTRAPLATFHREPGSGLSPRVARSASPLTCAAVHSLRQGSAARCPSLLVPPHHGSLIDPAPGRLGTLPGPWPTSGALLPDCGGGLLPLHHSFYLATEGQHAYHPRTVATSEGWSPRPVRALPPLGPWCDTRPRVTPVSLWTGSPGVAADFRVWGFLAHVRTPGANKLSPHIRACIFLGFPLEASSWVFYNPVTYQFFASQDVTFDESVCYYKSRPHRGTEAFSPIRGTTQLGEPDGTAGHGRTVEELAMAGPPEGSASLTRTGAGTRGAEPGGAEPGGSEPRGAEPRGVVPGGAESRGATSSGGPNGASPRLSPRPEPLSPQQLREWLVRRARLRSGAAGAGTTGDTGAGGAGVTAGAGGTGGTAAAGPGGARTGGAGAAGTGGVGGAGAGDPTEPGAAGAGGAGAGGTSAGDEGIGAGGTGAGGAGAGGAGAGGAGGTGAGGTVRPRPSYRASALVAELLGFAAACCLDYAIALIAESESDSPPSVEGECALGTDVLEDRQEDFECLAATVPRFASMLLALEGDSDALDIPTPQSYAEAITGPYSSQWQAAMDAEMASWKSTGTYVDAVPPSRANIVDGMWIFRVKRPQGSPPAFKARYIARGFSQRQGVDYFQTFSPSCEAEIYAGAMAVQELHWLTYLLTDLGEKPRSPPVLYVDNKAMIALCQEHTLEHRTKHITLRYFFARELQERGQLRLAYVAIRAITADIFTKALPPGYREVAHKGYNPIRSLSSSQWTRRSPLNRAVSPEPRQSRYHADGPFHLVLRSRVPPPLVLPQPPELSLTVLHDPLSDYPRASHLVVSHVLSALVTHPTAPLSSVSALVTTVAGFASSHRLDYMAHLVSDPARSPSSGGALVFPLEVLEDGQFELGFLAAAVPHLCAMLLAPEGDPDALDIPIPRTHAERVSRPWASYWIAAKEAGMACFRSTSTYVDTVPPPGTNVVSGMWLYKVKRSPGSPPVFKARHVARGFTWRDYELHSLDFTTAFLQVSLHEQIWLRRPPGFIGSFPTGTQWQLRRPIYGMRQAPREWHDTIRTTLAALDFFPSSADQSMFVRCGATPFFVPVYVDDLVFATPDQHTLASMKEKLQRRHTCTDLGELQRYLGLQITRDRAARTTMLMQSHMVEQILTRFRFPFSKVQLTPLGVDHGVTAPPSDEPLESSGPYPELVGCLICEAEVYAAAMAALELCWLTFLVTDLGERPRSLPVLFADNRSAVLLCEEPRLVGKAKHIQLRYFLLRELQQRSQALVRRVVSEANTVDIFTKALPPCDHQRFCTQLGLVPARPHLLM
ncbi:unnamed protein product, partial [Closterium sp. NIES-54]